VFTTLDVIEMSGASQRPKQRSDEKHHQPLLDSQTTVPETEIRTSIRSSGPAVQSFTARYNGEPPEALIFKGGGTKGVAYTGAMKRLEEAGLLQGIKKFAGTSAGSQVAAMLAFGFSGEELKDINQNSPWSQLLDSSHGCCGPCRNLSRLFRRFGICRGQFLQDYLDDLFKKKCGVSRCTFQQLFELSGTELRLGTCNMVTRRFEFLDRHNQPNMPICVACRASSSIPILFEPVRWQNALYVDGGLEGNLPISAFQHDSKILALNFRSESEASRPQQIPTNLIEFLKQSAEMLFEAAQGVHGVDTISAKAKELTGKGIDIIHIDTGAYGPLDTSMHDEELEGLVKAGYDAVHQYLCGDDANAEATNVSAS